MVYDLIMYDRRIRISRERTDFLKHLFVRKPYLTKKEKKYVSGYINVPVSFVNNWFQNMRASVRKKLNYTKHGHINKCSKSDPGDVFHEDNCDFEVINEVVFM